jgi:hypothetical protein
MPQCIMTGALMADQPQNTAPQEPAFYEVLLAHFAQKFGGSIPACPMCGSKGWGVDHRIAPVLYDQRESGATDRLNPPDQVKTLNLNAVMPLATIICRRCYYVAHFVWGPIAKEAERRTGAARLSTDMKLGDQTSWEDAKRTAGVGFAFRVPIPLSSLGHRTAYRCRCGSLEVITLVTQNSHKSPRTAGPTTIEGPGLTYHQRDRFGVYSYSSFEVRFPVSPTELLNMGLLDTISVGEDQGGATGYSTRRGRVALCAPRQ